MVTLLFILCFVGALYIICRAPLLFISIIVVLLISQCMQHSADAAERFEVSAIIEADTDRATMEDAVRDAAAIYRDQLGVDLVVTYVDINTVAGHTQAQFLLDAVKAYRVDSPKHRATDATVLFTRRDIRLGGTDLAGLATVGPACSAQASAIVEIRGDGADGAILAHELAHTVGVMHDAASGWLMSESVSRFGAGQFSPDSLATFRAAGVGECMSIPAANPPSAAVQAAPAAPSTGGGGSCDLLVLPLFALLYVWRLVRELQHENRRNYRLRQQREWEMRKAADRINSVAASLKRSAAGLRAKL